VYNKLLILIIRTVHYCSLETTLFTLKYTAPLRGQSWLGRVVKFCCWRITGVVWRAEWSSGWV